MKFYPVNEMFFSLQGEGVRAGTPNVFVRFSGCNQTCRVETHGFDCDTEFVSNRKLAADQILVECERLWGRGVDEPMNIILTGGEPLLHVDAALIEKLQDHHLIIETNGSLPVPSGIGWITVSPKVAEHAIRQLTANEIKYVRNVGQGIPVPACKAQHKLLSPAFDSSGNPSPGSLEWCMGLINEHPSWRLSVQQHKQWRVR